MICNEKILLASLFVAFAGHALPLICWIPSSSAVR
jgi:hypothetical protein